MPVLIAGIGTAVPPNRIAQAQAAELARQYSCETPDHERVFNAVYWGTGVETHSVVLQAPNGDTGARQSFYGDASPTTGDRMRKYEEEAGTLAVSAAQNALFDARIAPENVTHVVTVSCTGFYAPGFDIALIRQLGLSAGIARTHVGFMGCHGVLTGCVGNNRHAFVAADPAACVLVCAVEMCSLHHQYGWNAEKVVANSLFADGAGAVVVTASASPPPTLSIELQRQASTVSPILRTPYRAGRRSRFRDDALDSRARPDRPKLARLARRLVGSARADRPRSRFAVGRSSGRPTHPGGRGRPRSGSIAAAGNLSLRPGRVRQHVFADRSVYPRSGCDRPEPAHVLPWVSARALRSKFRHCWLEPSPSTDVRGFPERRWRYRPASQYHGAVDEDTLISEDGLTLTDCPSTVSTRVESSSSKDFKVSRIDFLER